MAVFYTNRRYKMKNVIKNIKQGQGNGTQFGFDYARLLADKHQEETGNKHIVERIVDYKDTFNGQIREHFSFDVVELIND